MINSIIIKIVRYTYGKGLLQLFSGTFCLKSFSFAALYFLFSTFIHSIIAIKPFQTFNEIHLQYEFSIRILKHLVLFHYNTILFTLRCLFSASCSPVMPPAFSNHPVYNCLLATLSIHFFCLFFSIQLKCNLPFTYFVNFI